MAALADGQRALMWGNMGEEEGSKTVARELSQAPSSVT